MVPGLKFSLTMSAVAISRSTASLPAGVCRSSARLFLLRLNRGKKPAPEPSSRRVLSPAERLDLDHLGAQVGQHHAAGRAHDHVGEFDDAHAS